MRRLRRDMSHRTIGLLVAAAIALGPLAARAESWATSQAAELSRQGRLHAAEGDAGVAVRRYLEAIELDPTYGPAYLGLGAAREQAGDVLEAERAYTMGIEHVNAFADGHLARARLRGRQHRAIDALADLAAAAELRPDDLGLLAELQSAYVAARALPAALGVARRMLALASDRQDAKILAQARLSAKALAALLRELDPVTAGFADRGPVRRAVALAARR